MPTTSDGPRTRRTFLTAALGGLGATAAVLLDRPRAVVAGGGAVMLGEDNSTAAGRTGVVRTDIRSWALLTGEVKGFEAFHGKASGVGVEGRVDGVNGRGVVGEISGHYTQIAVDGRATDGAGEGIGVRGRTKNGIAVQGIATAPGGYGLEVQGRAVFSRSGKVTFAAGQATRTVSGHAITPASLVLATIQGNIADTYVRGVSLSDANDSFTIRLNRAAPRKLTVGWFIAN